MVTLCDTFHLAWNVIMHRKSRGPALCIMRMSTVVDTRIMCWAPSGVSIPS